MGSCSSSETVKVKEAKVLSSNISNIYKNRDDLQIEKDFENIRKESAQEGIIESKLRQRSQKNLVQIA